MVDVSNKIENNLESKKLNNFEKTLDTIDNVTKVDFEKEAQKDDITNNIFNSTISEQELESANNSDTENPEVVNCLALTVKKDYSLSIVKNVVVRTFKRIWKVAVSIFTLHLFKFFM